MHCGIFVWCIVGFMRWVYYYQPFRSLRSLSSLLMPWRHEELVVCITESHNVIATLLANDRTASKCKLHCHWLTINRRTPVCGCFPWKRVTITVSLCHVINSRWYYRIHRYHDVLHKKIKIKWKYSILLVCMIQMHLTDVVILAHCQELAMFWPFFVDKIIIHVIAWDDINITTIAYMPPS